MTSRTRRLDIERSVCKSIASDVRTGIASITDKDGNYLGGDDPYTAVTVEAGLKGHDVLWKGKQITFLEFGTGAAGAGRYSGPAMAQAGYSPDPTKKAWVYHDAKTDKGEWSHGLTPQAPMLNAAIAARQLVNFAPAKVILKEALRRAVTV